MQKRIIVLLIVCFALVGCNQKDNAEGGFDRKGIITEIDSKGNRILVNDSKSGLIWVTLPDHGNIKNYEEGQEVVVWIKGTIAESLPAQATALNIEPVDGERNDLPTYDFKDMGFPPYPFGFIKINETEYEMERGGFKWRKGNQTVLTDAASPTQIAERFEAIVLEPNSKVNIVIEQKPNLNVYLWDSSRTDVAVEGTQLTMPANKGRYIYEVLAKWSNGEVSYTFVIEVE